MHNVILTGYMGCGKSTVGKRLSFALKQPYIDTDKEIEQAQGCTINDIFDEHDEAYFRDLETNYIRSLFELKQGYVISVGGGLPIREENRKLLKELGKVIYLRAKADTIYERLKDDTTRPLLRGDDPLGKIKSMLEVRGPIYTDGADVIIDVDGLNSDEVLKKILEVLKRETVSD